MAGRSMSLSTFIGGHREKIVSEFAVFARTLMPPGPEMTDAELRDHAIEILTAVVQDMGVAQTLRSSPSNRKARAPRGPWKPRGGSTRMTVFSTVSRSG